MSQIKIVGQDEVGTGSYFGDITVVSVFVKDEDDLKFLKSLGVNDSKTLTDTRIRELAPQILEKLTVETICCDNKNYNRVVPSRYNANSIKVSLHNAVLLKMLKQLDELGLKAERHIVDGFTTIPNWDKYVQGEREVAPGVELIQKAESQYTAVAAASVVARYLFLESLDRDSEKAGIKLLSGASSNVDEVGRELVKKKGQQILKELAKYHFSNTMKILD